MKLSILIKTYNEEEKIRKCLDAVFVAIRGVHGVVEVIVADSLSTDATVDLASTYPVKIVQLCMPLDRGCGAGVQLGFQHSKGEFVYLLDGDMELQHDFLVQALELIEKDVSIGGVAGILQDSQMSNWFDRRRDKSKPSAIAGELDWLAGGGLYRRAALLDSGGYAGNRNLKAFEEAELGLRLGHRGWRMLRLPIVAVIHTGHAESTLSLIVRQWRNGRLNSGGVLLKSAIGRPWFFRGVRMFIHPLAVIGYWVMFFLAILVFTTHLVVVVFLTLAISAGIVLSINKRSLIDAGFSVLLWHLAAIGLVKGLCSPPLLQPLLGISSVILIDGKSLQ
jgi:glycosyltransferase involved in cell wall biosynthesis